MGNNVQCKLVKRVHWIDTIYGREHQYVGQVHQESGNSPGGSHTEVGCGLFSWCRILESMAVFMLQRSMSSETLTSEDLNV